MNQTFNVAKLAKIYANKSAHDILKLAFHQFGDGLWVSFSGAEDVVLIDIAWKLNKNVKVFSLDTGRLYPETYQFIEQVREFYKIDIELISPDHVKLEPFIKEKGLFSFYKDRHDECCGIRKIEPLRRKLSGVSAWVTGQRSDQSPSTRSKVAALEVDANFSTPKRTLYKFNPLIQMASEEAWNYIRMLELPYNSLHKRGFISIGCEPCTRPVLPNQHEREGRWWWEEDTHKECGLHTRNIISKE
ncbi:phosphoadenylyl-sulfate reductase [Candidatus Pseudomonas adelgestsugas]|nr:phosphoadenylyl-sulfate reductase [Candidatus Pseudomonas adelgestsugas]